MVYKRYIKKNGKIYGPYTYHSKKENGKVISTYLGKSKPKKNYNQIIFIGAFFLLIFLSLFFVVKFDLTGKVSLSLEESYEFGEQIIGSVKLNLKQGELIPSSTKVMVDNAGEINEFLLSDLISYNFSEGNFYVENLEIFGTGNGYGVLGEKIIYPNVSFVLNILPKGFVVKPEKEEKEEIGEILNETTEPEIIPENKTEIVNETIEQGEVIEPESEIVSPRDDSSKDDSGEPSGEPNETEEIIEEPEIKEPEQEIVEEEQEEVDTTGVSPEGTIPQYPKGHESTELGGKEIEPEKESKEKEEVKEEKVKEEKEKVKEEKVEPEPAPEPEPEPSPLTGEVISEQILEIEGIISKDQSFSYELPQGKSAEIKSSSQEIELLIIDDTAVVTTEYSETEKGFGEDYLTEEIFEFLIDLNQLNLIAQEEGDLIITFIYNDTEIVSVNEKISIEGKELEIPIIEQNLTELNITIQNQTIVNETIITITNITEGEINLTTIQYGAVLNKPVKWKKNIKLTQPSTNLSVEIPIQAENISVYIISSLEKQELIEPEQELEIVNETVDTTGVPLEQGTLYKGQEETFVINETSEQEEIIAEVVPESEIISPRDTQGGHENPKEGQDLQAGDSGEPNETIEEDKQPKEKTKKEKTKKEKIPDKKIKITAKIISGEISAEIDLKEKSIFSDFFRKIFKFMTGRAIDVEEKQEVKEILIEENVTEVEIEYETPAPYAIESQIWDDPAGPENISKGKRIIIASEVRYENILAYTFVEDSVLINSSDLKLYWYASYEDALAYNASLVQNITEENITINETAEQNITIEINESVSEQNITEQETNESISNKSVSESPIWDDPAGPENITSEENITLNKESYSSILTGNVIVNETFENITINETGIINESVEVINETLTEIINETIEQEILNETEIINETSVLENITEFNISIIENYSDKIKIQVPYTAYDLDYDGYVDYIEWLVPHLSNQTYELIIEITKAEHLDENRSFISDIYNEVKALDGNWSEVINDSEYVRVTFEQELDNTRDITIYARSVCAVSGNSFVMINETQVSCGIYQKKKRIEEIRRLLDE